MRSHALFLTSHLIPNTPFHLVAKEEYSANYGPCTVHEILQSIVTSTWAGALGGDDLSYLR